MAEIVHSGFEGRGAGYVLRVALKAVEIRVPPARTMRAGRRAKRRAGPRRLTLGAHSLRRQVAVDLQLNSVFAVDERAQSFSADITLVASWTDARLRNPQAQAEEDHALDILESGAIWSPRLALANRRDGGRAVEGVVRVLNTGRVTVVERHVGEFAALLDVRDFPVDTQASRLTSPPPTRHLRRIRSSPPLMR